ncbi:MAG: 6-phosphogluconolactonase [Acidobacteriota bacterium]
MRPEVVVAGDAEDLVEVALTELRAAAFAAVAARGRLMIALSGGSTPFALYRRLAELPEEGEDELPWEHIHWFWGDERCVAPEDPDSNYGNTRDALLDHAPIPAANLHRMRGEDDPQEAARAYEEELRTVFSVGPTEVPRFDLVLLGIGPDGHTASLFPGSAALAENRRLCVANRVDRLAAWRLTLTYPVLDAARAIAFLAEGDAKAAIVARVLGPLEQPPLPAQLVAPRDGRLLFLLDAAAAAQLPR